MDDGSDTGSAGEWQGGGTQMPLGATEPANT